MTIEEPYGYKRKVRRDYWIMFIGMVGFGLMNVLGFAANRSAIQTLEARVDACERAMSGDR